MFECLKTWVKIDVMHLMSCSVCKRFGTFRIFMTSLALATEDQGMTLKTTIFTYIRVENCFESLIKRTVSAHTSALIIEYASFLLL